MSAVTFLFQQMFFFSIPLMIAALGSMYSNRSGVTNIALESMMIMGAFTGSMYLNAIGVSSSQKAYLFAMLIAGMTGLLFSLLHAFCSVTLRANQRISGIALNLLAPAFCIFAARLLYGRQQVKFSVTFMLNEILPFSNIPIFGDIFFKRAFISTYIGIVILIAAAFIINKTRFGLRLRACGEYPQAADSVGVNVYLMRYIGVMISGFLCGMAGIIFVVTTSNQFNATVSGYGFLAMAVMIFGQWRPYKICIAGLFFGLFKTLSAVYSGIPVLLSLNLSTNIYKMLPYIFTLIALAFTARTSNAPRAAGEAFEKGMR